MSSAKEIEHLARSGADSVFNYIERTAEVVPDGIRWQTIGYEGEPTYHYRIFCGCAGISFFLADYYKITGIEKAKDLALGCCKGCFAFEPKDNYRGLLNGQSGVGLAWLHLSKTLQDSDLLSPCFTQADILLNGEIGPQTDLFGGVAGAGLFLYRLWEASQDEKFLASALQHGDWLIKHAIRNHQGCLWPWHLHEEPTLFGFAHGNAGIAHFLLLLFNATQEAKWKDIVLEVIETLHKHAIHDHGGRHWPRIPDPDKNEMLRCQWCNGSPGIGLFFARAFEILKNDACLETAKLAGETTFAYGDLRKNSSQCHGLAGNAELFIELFRLTDNPLWLARAFDFARMALHYRQKTANGDLWQADEKGQFSQDFCCGAAGTGHFFLRLMQPHLLQMPIS